MTINVICPIKYKEYKERINHFVSLCEPVQNFQCKFIDSN